MTETTDTKFDVVSHREKCRSLSTLLVEKHPSAVNLCISYFESNPPPWHEPDTSEPAMKKKKKSKHRSQNSRDQHVKDEDILRFVLLCLETSPAYFRNKWKWSSFIERYSNVQSDTAKWLMIKCLAIVNQLSEKEVEDMFRTMDLSYIQCRLDHHFRSEESISPQSTDVHNSILKSVTVAGIEVQCVQYSDLAEGQKSESNKTIEEHADQLVLVKSAKSNLQSLALAVASQKPVCLIGPVGCGKTALVHYLAEVTGRKRKPHFLTVQLGEELDAKMLLGSYKCTDIMGEFVWQPGILTQAMMNGYWLLLEDIDSVSSDVVAVFQSLIQNNSLNVPGFKDNLVPAHGFQLFFTQRVLSGATGVNFQKRTPATELLSKLWRQVSMEPMTSDELVHIIQTKFPILATVASRMVKVYLLFSSGLHDSTEEVAEYLADVGRLTSTRDLMKWCVRVEKDFQVTSQESGLAVCQEALDIFLGHVAKPDVRQTLGRKVAATLGIVHMKADYFLELHRPTIQLQDKHCVVGRVSLPRVSMGDLPFRVSNVKDNFALTRIASCLIEKIAVCLSRSEPVLLVGETATGKTTTLQLLAQHTNNSLVVINMNQQSDSTDLLGGFKPIDFKLKMKPLRDSFESLFRKTFPMQKNKTFMTKLSEYFSQSNWKVLLSLMINVAESAQQKLLTESSDDSKLPDSTKSTKVPDSTKPATDSNKRVCDSNKPATDSNKRVSDSNKQATDSNKSTNTTKSATGKSKRVSDATKTSKSNDSTKSAPDSNRSAAESSKLAGDWRDLLRQLKKLHGSSKKKSDHAMAFSFIEGTLVKALREGHWILLDEINLASAETLQCLSGLLERHGSVCLYERGDIDPVPRHPNFRLMAAMNPATDVGKKDLPAGLRNRFTELFVDELVDPTDLSLLISCYLPSISLEKRQHITSFYLKVKKENSLADGTGHKPHFSLRTLCRALAVANRNPCYSQLRSLYEAFCLSVDSAKHIISEELPEKPRHVRFEGYWIAQGREEPSVPAKYILTPQVQSNLQNLARAVALSSHPVLIQGDTSVGKTSLVTYLAQSSGHRCFRINNHEHTDFQEYVGAYCAHPETGQLVFQEGVLAKAMRLGYWIILDELNLAPCEVLEALNRVLDDNRELYIPETQETIRAHPDFRVFATQNPPGLYGGRKILSRAFRNRFIELHFNEIPAPELETILHKRCEMPPSYAKKVVAVMGDLGKQRRGSAAFAGKSGFMTLRDLFRWGERYRLASHVTNPNHYDWDQHIADEGYLVLAGRVRKHEEKDVIRATLEKIIKRKVDTEKLFTLNENTSPVTRHILERVTQAAPDKFHNVVWTHNMRQLAVLIGKAVEFQEPVLLVGETGCGKTTMCQILASLHGQTLYMINCHQHTESSDFLGGLRPVRNRTEGAVEVHKLFEWVDGPLIHAMKTGGMFLADEISLADDSVLERLNSLLEPERKLVISEKGDEIAEELTAHAAFHFIGTMNPGGDFGKKELSPALRNRLSEIWCEPCTADSDLVQIVEHNLDYAQFGFSRDKVCLGKLMLEFRNYFLTSEFGKRATFSIRDYLTWVNFINVTVTRGLSLGQAYVHGAFVTFLDILGTGSTSSLLEQCHGFRRKCFKYLRNQMIHARLVSKQDFRKTPEITRDSGRFGTWGFYIDNKSTDTQADMKGTELFSFKTPTTHSNLIKILRAMQLPHKAILLEGSPGVGKTALLKALAEVTGHQLTRINLSEQTDVCDLFGTDLPVDGGDGGQFEWKDGPFLKALKDEHWILLDELNLASQSVLEGLNAVLDHRGELYIPEIGRSFLVKPGTRLFATQNPLSQGSSRKGLPKSFLNRFTQVYISSFTSDDTKLILKHIFHDLVSECKTFSKVLDKMLIFNDRLNAQCGREFGFYGAPWEMNLRDLVRWVEAMQAFKSPNPGDFVSVIYIDRMRTAADKSRVETIYASIFPEAQFPLKKGPFTLYATPSEIYFGDICIEKVTSGVNLECEVSQNLVLREHYNALRSLAVTCRMKWMTILVGGEHSKQLIHTFAQLSGRKLHIVSVSSEMDTMEILGGYEQIDLNRHLSEIASEVERYLLYVLSVMGEERRMELMRLVEKFNDLANQVIPLDEQKDTKVFLNKCDRLIALLRPLSDLTSTMQPPNQKMDSSSVQPSNQKMDSSATTQPSNEDVDMDSSNIQPFSQDLGTPKGVNNIQSVETDPIKSSPEQSISENSIQADTPLQSTHADLIAKLEALKKRILQLSQSGKIASGGFEWVDSILVKCLRQGAWLLMDNVNMCSAAVLDRLNGLLEPRGVLTLHERGVTPEGDLYTIEPHPDFRLFLCMDPKYGEISRAMRNRGVEIAIEEIPLVDSRVCAVRANPDLREQLAGCGVEEFNIQCILAQVHVTLNEHCAISYDNSHALRAAHLFSQYRQQGFDVSEALRIACGEIYLKCLMWCPSQYKAMGQVLTDLLAEGEKLATDLTCVKSATDVTCANTATEYPVLPIRTRDYLYDATFTRIRHQTWLLHCYLLQYARTGAPLRTQDLLPISTGKGIQLEGLNFSTTGKGIQLDELNFNEVFPYLVTIAYDYACVGDLEFRRQYILTLIERIKLARSQTSQSQSSLHQTDVPNISNTSKRPDNKSQSNRSSKKKRKSQKSQLEACDTTIESCDNTNTKVDTLNNTTDLDILNVIVNIVHNVTESQYEIVLSSETCRPFDVRRTQIRPNLNSTVNDKCVLLKHYYVNKLLNAEKREEEDSFTVVKYSKLFEEDGLPFTLNSNILDNFNLILAGMDQILHSILTTPSAQFSSQDFALVYLTLVMKDRFESLGHLTVRPDQCQNEVQHMLATLHLYFQWFHKMFGKCTERFYWNDSTPQTKLHRSRLLKFGKLSSRLLRDYSRHYQKLLVLCRKKFSALLPMPLPPSSASVAKLCTVMKQAWDPVNVWNHGLSEEEVSARTLLLMSEQGRALHSELTRAASHLTADQPPSEATALAFIERIERLSAALGRVKAALEERATGEESSWEKWEEACRTRQNAVQSGAENQRNTEKGAQSGGKNAIQSSGDKAGQSQGNKAVLSAEKAVSSDEKSQTGDLDLFTNSNAESNDIGGDAQNVKFSAQIKLVPFYEYLALKLVQPVSSFVHNEILMGRQKPVKVCSELRVLSGLLAESRATPPSVQARIRGSTDYMDLLIDLAELSLYGAAVFRPAAWMYTEEVEKEGEEEEGDVEMPLETLPKDLLLSTEHPLLCHLLTHVLVKPHTHQFSHSSLGTHAQRSTLLTQIKSLLWRNLPVIAKTTQSAPSQLLASVKSQYEALAGFVERVAEGGEAVPRGLRHHLSLARDYLYHSSPGELAEARGEIQLLLGHSQLLILSKMELIDPVEKTKLKLAHVRHTMRRIQAMLTLEAQHSVLMGDGYRFPYADVLTRTLATFEDKEQTCEKRVGVRPEQNALMYSNMLKEVNNFCKNVASEAKILDLIQCRKLCTVHQKQAAAGYFKAEMVKATTDVKAELSQWRYSVLSFLHKLRAEYGAWYPDVVTPLVYAVLQMVIGVNTILIELQRNLSLAQLNTASPVISPLLSLLVRFPFVDKDNCLEFIATVNTREFIQRFEKCFQHEKLQNIIAIRGRLQGETWDTMKSILAQLVTSWHSKADREAREQLETESLYVHKTRTLCTTESEEEETDRYVAEMFPTNRDEFREFEEPASLETNTTSVNIVKTLEKTISEDKMLETCLLHSNIVKTFTSTHWLVGGAGAVFFDPVKPFVERFSVFSVFLENYLPALEASLDNDVLSSLVLMSEVALQHRTHQPSKEYDFYRDPNVEQIQTCLPILHSLDRNVCHLLEEWPEHPTLQSIHKLIGRILSFDMTSPVARFLTGLEILMGKVHEWEQVAHSGVSLAIHSEELTAQIIAWRKFELSLWKNCLGITSRRIAQETSKFWFHLYSVCENFVQDETMSAEQVRKVLANFVENCSLGAFHSRLDLLLTFHCHSLELARSHPRARLLSYILYNLYRYFGQFLAGVNGKIQEQSAPIQKQVKDFVKIARWNDINYYAVKQTTEKTHRTLAKHVKEFERVLRGHVSAGMTDLEEAKKVVTGKEYVLAETMFTSKMSQELRVQLDLVENRLYPLVVTKLHARSTKLCRTIMSGNNYNALIGAVNEFVTTILENLEHARGMSVDTNQIKEKQKSQAKQFLQFKRKCLVDLFSLLTRAGLSYRYGTVSTTCSLKEISAKYFTTPPINVKIAMEKLDRKDCDGELISSWSGFDKHLLRSQARLSQLLPLLKKPHKQVSPQTIPRLRGFASHLMYLNVEQNAHLIQCIHLFYSLRCCLTLVPEISTKTKLLKPFKTSAKELLSDLHYYFKQLDVLLSACPEQRIDKGLLSEKCNTIISACKHDAKYNEMKEKIDNVLKRVAELTARLNKVETTSDFLEQMLVSMNVDSSYCSLLVSNELCFALDEVFTILNSLLDDIQYIKKQFDIVPKLLPSHLNYKEPYVRYSLTNGLWRVEQKITENCERYFELNLTAAMFCEPKEIHLETTILENSYFKSFETKVDEFLHKIMIPIQELYKKYVDNTENVDVSNIGEKSVHELITKNHLKEKLFEYLAKDVNALNMQTVLLELLGLLSQCMNAPGHLLSSCVRTVQQVLPLLDQYCLLCEYFITHEAASLRASTKLCSIICATFCDLAKRGFCVADELVDDNEGEGQDMKGGMGLGDDEGQNDVSDQIESQDQMEECKPEGSKEKDEDKDCKEEEKGVEMSDDFSGKLQDVEENPEEGEEEKEDEKEKEEDPDNEMGETDANAEKLDEEVWGSDSEEEPEDENDKTEDDADKGKQTGEKELGAKDNSKNETEGEDKEEYKDDNKKEINEMDDEGEEDQDQIDPLHGNQEPLPEPEPFDLPDNLNLDGEEQEEGEEGAEEENPLEVDQMKEPDTVEDEQEEPGKDNKENDQVDSSDDEGDKEEDGGEKGEDLEKEEADGEEEEETEDGGNVEEEQAQASEDRPNLAEAEAADNKDDGSKDQVKTPSESKESKPLDPQDSNMEEATGPEQKGVGNTDKTEKKSKGHEGDKEQSRQSKEEDKENNEKKRQKPGESNEERSLGDVDEPMKKRLKTKNSDKENRLEPEEEEEQERKADLYEHIKESKEKEKKRREQTLDVATDEQAEKQVVPDEKEEKVDEEEEGKEGGEELMETEPETLPDEEDVPTQKSEKLENKAKKNKNKRDETSNEPDEQMDTGQPIEIEGEVIQTQNVERGTESTFHTLINEYQSLDQASLNNMDPAELRLALQRQLASWTQPPPTSEASRAWDLFSAAVHPLAQQLSQELRLVLEPTRASSLRGDFRTGRRINMRKVIPYIASKFRKDKIWLRRTKPQKRDYQIVLAIDDSSSMADNQSRELAFESLALVSKALTLLETGELSIVSFGESTKVLHHLGDQFSEISGASILQQFKFDQTKTRVASLVEEVCRLFVARGSNSGSSVAQLLVIISDGRNINNEGANTVKSAVKMAKALNVFIVFLIIDNPQSKNSILDIRMPVFNHQSKVVSLNSYLDSFPFPFYLILRDINSLPSVLSDALRQWFELVTSSR
ncbi:hypothetical protein M8J75_015055 [Diaphorina citri]|nr:hypothetical protein M8J75_015055 [Diaphorina citri]